MPRSALRLACSVVLTAILAAGGAAACSDDDPPQDGDGSSTSAPATSVGVAPEDPGELTADEERVIGALGSLGVTAAPAEHAGPRGASVQAVLEDGSTVLLTATPAGVEPAGVTVLEQRTVAGVAIAVVEYASAPGRRTQLTCGDLTYELYGLAGADWPVPPGFSGPDAFLGALVDALGC